MLSSFIKSGEQLERCIHEFARSAHALRSADLEIINAKKLAEETYCRAAMDSSELDFSTGMADNISKDAQDADPKDKGQPGVPPQGPTLTKKQKKQLQAIQRNANKKLSATLKVETRKDMEPAQDASLPEATAAPTDSSFLETSQLADANITLEEDQD